MTGKFITLGFRNYEVLLYSVIQISPTLDKEMEETTLAAISAAHKKMKFEIHDLSERLKTSKDLIRKLKEEIEKAEEDVNS